MSLSIFSRIYSYREKDGKNNRENYLIEIFAFALQNDRRFAQIFLEKVGIAYPGSAISIQTQVVDAKYGRPDILMAFDNTVIVIECKVDSNERANQLADYAKILDKKKAQNKHLIFLTKYYEYKEEKYLKLLRWKDIIGLIDDDSSEITKQLQTYLSEQNMDMDTQFRYSDIVTMQSFGTVLLKMDEVLNQVKPYYEKNFGKPSKDSSRSTRLINNRYINYQETGNRDSWAEISYGYYWDWEDHHDDVCIGISVTGLDKDLSKQIKAILPLWEQGDVDSDYWYIGKYEPLAAFVLDGKNHAKEMVDFLRKGIDELSAVKKKIPKLFGKK
ncbi:MAG: PD-(D/E)XK nuclease family protein [Flavobacteriales bacterium]|nr:PD-(D/E)XK nuclease family protein [Flavobacteriales bacterium]